FSLSFLTICAVMVIYDVDVVGDYLALAVCIACVWVGVGGALLLSGARADRRLYVRALPAGSVFLGAILLILPLAQALANYPVANLSHFDEPRRFWSQIAAWAGSPRELPQ